MTPRRPRPPGLVRLLLRFLLPEEEREFFLGDLEERRRASWFREILGAAALRLGPRPRAPRPPRGDSMFRELQDDLRYGLRTMLRSPAFTLVALVTMALGIGANTAMFSIVNGVVLRPLPYPEADRIVRVWENNLSRGWNTFSLAPLNYWDWRERNRSLDLFGAYLTTMVNRSGGDRPETISALRVTEDYLEILGGEPTRGRGITRDDLSPDADPVALLTHGFWLRAFGGDGEVLGTTMVLDDVAHTVVGILPEEWRIPGGSTRDVLLPLTPSPFWYEARSSHFIHAYGRLAPGVTVEQARSDLSSIAGALEAEYPDSNTGWGATVRPLDEVVLGSTRPQLLIFMASVGLILLIACANLANMMLARSMVRTREMAIRTAVGAGTGRVVRQLLAESLLLAAAGGALGVALAYGALSAFVEGWPSLLPRMNEIEVSGAVLLFSSALSLAAGLLFGLVPAANVAGPNLTESLRQGGRSVSGSRSRRWMRAALVTAEVALAVLLLVGSGLLLRSFGALLGEDPGFRTENRLVFAVPLSRARYGSPEDRRAFADAVLPRLAALPGVESAALSSLIPMAGDDEIWGFWLEGRASTEAESGSALFYRVSPGYFQAMGIPLLAGRDITSDDRPDGARVAVVSASFAEQHFAGQNPLGRTFRFGREEDLPSTEIVGVVGDVQHYRLGQASMPQIYSAYPQRPSGYINVVLETSVPPLGVVGQVRDAVAAVDPDQPLVDVQPADALLSDAMATPRFRTFLMAGFGLIALLMAVVGLYGVMAYSVSQRTKEIGVRMALGATRRSVLALIFREGTPLVAAGLLLGLASGLALSRILESMLFGVGTRDPAVFAGAPLILTAVAVVAMFIPARRASRVDPVRTLGEE